MAIINQLLAHGLKRHVLGSAGIPVDAPGILLGEKALGDGDVQINGQAYGTERDPENQRLVPQNPAEAARVPVVQAVEGVSLAR